MIVKWNICNSRCVSIFLGPLLCMHRKFRQSRYPATSVHCRVNEKGYIKLIYFNPRAKSLLEWCFFATGNSLLSPVWQDNNHNTEMKVCNNGVPKLVLCLCPHYSTNTIVHPFISKIKLKPPFFKRDQLSAFLQKNMHGSLSFQPLQ